LRAHVFPKGRRETYRDAAVWLSSGSAEALLENSTQNEDLSRRTALGGAMQRPQSPP